MTRLRQPIDASDHVLGRADARVTLVEYGDYECSFCGRAHQIVQDLLLRLGDDVRFAFRHFPLAQAHPHALDAAQAAESAGAQGRYWDMHATLFENQTALTMSDLTVYAKRLGLDVGRFVGEIQRGVHLAKIQSDFRTGVGSGVKGTPAFFIDGVPYEDDWQDTERFLSALREGPPPSVRVGP